MFFLLPHNSFFSADIETETLSEIEGVFNSVDIDTEEVEFCYQGLIRFVADIVKIEGEEYIHEEGKEIKLNIDHNSDDDVSNIILRSTQNGDNINFFSSLGRQDLVGEKEKDNPTIHNSSCFCLH